MGGRGSSLTSSLEISVKGDDFISLTLLASSKTLFLLVFMVSGSTREDSEVVHWRGRMSDTRIRTHDHVGIIDDRRVLVGIHLATF